MPALPADEARRRFASARVARLATIRPDGSPHLVPISFALDESLIYTAVDDKPKRSSALQRLRNVEGHPEVSLLVDHYDEDWGRLWWVRADGLARAEVSGAEHAAAVRALAAKYPQYGGAPNLGPVLAIAVRRWSGWTSAEAARDPAG